MGGSVEPPDVISPSNGQMTDNVTAFKRPPTQRQDTSGRRQTSASGCPIFACLVIVYTGFRYSAGCEAPSGAFSAP